MLSYHTHKHHRSYTKFNQNSKTTMSLLPQDIHLPKPPSSPLSTPPSKSPLQITKSEEMESDDDLFRVPDMDEEKTTTNKEESSCSGGAVMNPGAGGGGGKKKRGRNPVDKEYRRIKRLLRNRVSAQQARERKKVYVNELEWKEKELQDLNFQLEEKISTLVNENSMLRKILMNTRPKVDESVETKAD